MRMVDLDRFLIDLSNEGCDVCRTDSRCPLYSEYGYSYDLIERVVERQPIINSSETAEE